MADDDAAEHDPHAAPDYAPDTSRGLDAAWVIGEGAPTERHIGC